MTAQLVDDPDVRRVFGTYSEPVHKKLMELRHLILEVATGTAGVGAIQETLKWGQISYVTHRPKSGTTIRIDEYQRPT